MKQYWILDEQPSARRYFCDDQGNYVWDTEKEANEARTKSDETRKKRWGMNSENCLVETRRLSLKRLDDFEMISTLSEHYDRDLFDYINKKLDEIEKVNMKIEKKDKEDKERIEAYIKKLEE
jgi:vacuolar-type H+-ATPase subunit I/STV1